MHKPDPYIVQVAQNLVNSENFCIVPATLDGKAVEVLSVMKDTNDGHVRIYPVAVILTADEVMRLTDDQGNMPIPSSLGDYLKERGDNE